MIYGEKFLNYGIENINEVELMKFDLFNISTLLESIEVADYDLVLEKVDLSSIFKKIFDKIKEFFLKVLGYIKTVIDFIHNKLDKYITKLIQALKKEESTLEESTITEAVKDETILISKLKTTVVSKMDRTKSYITDMGLLLTNFYKDLTSVGQKDYDNIKNKFRDIEQLSNAFYDKYKDMSVDCSTIVDKLKDAKENDLFDYEEISVGKKNKKEIKELIIKLSEIQKEIASYKKYYQDLDGFINNLKSEYFTKIEKLNNEMADKAIDNDKRPEYVIDNYDGDEEEFKLAAAHISKLYTFTNAYFNDSKKVITNILTILSNGFNSNKGFVSYCSAILKAPKPPKSPTNNISGTYHVTGGGNVTIKKTK